MSTYDDALSLIENEVNRDCEYYVYSQLRDAVDGLDMDCERLSEENAKLRELVKHLYTCLTRPKVYDGTVCPYFIHDCNHVSCGFARRMRELGIEESRVDGDTEYA